MIIGIDLDEVLADFMNPFIRFHNEKYKTSLKRDDFTSYFLWNNLGGTEEETKLKLDEFDATDYFKDIQPIPDSIETTKILNLYHRLIILTSRPLNTNNETRYWVNRFFSNIFSDLYFTNKKRKKSEICLDLNISLLIEDSLEYALESALKDIKVLLFDCPWNQSNELQKNITRVYSWSEIANIILNLV